jgi:hypothetical protein
MKKSQPQIEELTSIRSLAQQLGYEQTTLWRFIKRTPAIQTYRLSQVLAVSPAQVKAELVKLEARGKKLGYSKVKTPIPA